MTWTRLRNYWDWSHRFGARSRVVRQSTTTESIWRATSTFTATFIRKLSYWPVSDRTARWCKEAIDFAFLPPFHCDHLDCPIQDCFVLSYYFQFISLLILYCFITSYYSGLIYSLLSEILTALWVNQSVSVFVITCWLINQKVITNTDMYLKLVRNLRKET